MDTQKVIEAVQGALKAHKEDQEKHPRPTWPVSSLQDAIEAYDQETITWAISYGLQLMLEQLGIPSKEAEAIAFQKEAVQE